MYSYIQDPVEIERKSFEIIETELKKKYAEGAEKEVVKRVIHTTTDFEYEEILGFKQGVAELFMEALAERPLLISDTQMIVSGLNKPLLKTFDLEAGCFVAQPSIKEYAQEHEMTRSMAAVDYGLTLPGKKLFIIGNAPTALYRILEKYENHKEEIVGVIGVPVGFVGAQESKQALWESAIPCIVTHGRKGGSTVAVAILHALLKQVRKEKG
jgi:precorrin-8X/cobalt-precorrin-8 methylmutase